MNDKMPNPELSPDANDYLDSLLSPEEQAALTSDLQEYARLRIQAAGEIAVAPYRY